MSRLISFVVAVIGFASPAAGDDLALCWSEAYGDWGQGPVAGVTPSNWYPLSPDGRTLLRNLSPGQQTPGITRAFGLGPLVMPNVQVSDGQVTQLNLVFPTDYWASPGSEKVTGSVLLQPFVARGDSIIKAAVNFVSPPPSRGVKYSIWNAGPEGDRVGPEAFRPPALSGHVAVWCHGQVPVTPGRLYYLRVEGTKGSSLEVKLADRSSPFLPLIVDGKLVPGAALAGWVQSDPPGVSTTMACVEGVMKTDPAKDMCKGECGQTFIARGRSLAMIDFRPFVPGKQGDIGIEIIVRRGGAKGQGISKQRVSGPNGSVLQAVWPMNAVRLEPGAEYCVELRHPAGGGFKTSRVPGEIYPGGYLVVDDVPIGYLDMDMNIVEYALDTVPPSPPGLRVLSGDGVARIEYTAPTDPDVRRIQIRYRTGEHGSQAVPTPAEDRLLLEIDVVPGQAGVAHHTGLTNFQPYSYAVYATDVNANVSRPATAAAYPGKGPVLPVRATLRNGNFEKTSARGATATGWSFKIGGGQPQCQGRREADGSASFGWGAAAPSVAELFQTVTVQPGRRYELSARVKATGMASAGLQIRGADAAPSVRLSGEWQTLKAGFTAQRPDSEIVLVGSTEGSGEIRFADVQIRDVTTDVAGLKRGPKLSASRR